MDRELVLAWGKDRHKIPNGRIWCRLVSCLEKDFPAWGSIGNRCLVTNEHAQLTIHLCSLFSQSLFMSLVSQHYVLKQIV